MIWAFGKAILLGEHAVVYGHPALAGAIDCPVLCTIATRAASEPAIRLRVPRWNLDVASSDDHPVARALRAMLDGHGGAPDGSSAGKIDIDIDTELPAAAGLGSSAALSVTLARALAHAAGQTPSDEQVEILAELSERCFHDNPSGIDVALACRGGLGLYRRGRGLEPVDAPPIALAVGLSGQPRRTADMVGRVARARERDRQAADAHLAWLGEAALAGRDALVRGDLGALGALMTRAHEILAELGVSAPVLDDLVAIALAHGALGAKLTGGGGGGAVIAVADGDHHELVQAWRDQGFAGFVCNLGARP